MRRDRYHDYVTQSELVDATPLIQTTGNSLGSDMAGLVATEGGPSIMVLESGIQALVKVTGFTYIQGVPLALCGLLEEDVNAGYGLVCRADGVDEKLIFLAAGTNGAHG